MEFLSKSELKPRALDLTLNNLSPEGLLGNGNQALEVAVFSSSSKPSSGILEQALKKENLGELCQF